MTVEVAKVPVAFLGAVVRNAGLPSVGLSSRTGTGLWHDAIDAHSLW